MSYPGVGPYCSAFDILASSISKTEPSLQHNGINHSYYLFIYLLFIYFLGEGCVKAEFANIVYILNFKHFYYDFYFSFLYNTLNLVPKEYRTFPSLRRTPKINYFLLKLKCNSFLYPYATHTLKFSLNISVKTLCIIYGNLWYDKANIH